MRKYCQSSCCTASLDTGSLGTQAHVVISKVAHKFSPMNLVNLNELMNPLSRRPCIPGRSRGGGRGTSILPCILIGRSPPPPPKGYHFQAFLVWNEGGFISTFWSEIGCDIPMVLSRIPILTITCFRGHCIAKKNNYAHRFGASRSPLRRKNVLLRVAEIHATLHRVWNRV